MNKISPKVDMIVDMQFGSTGKGLIAGYLAEKNKYDTVITANMPNAGHTYINKDGRKWMHKVLPNGLVSPEIKRVMIGAGAVFDLERLWEELYDCSDFIQWVGIKHMAHKGNGRPVQLVIHPNAMCLSSEHKEFEQSNLSGISSTMQGSMAALVEKMRRDPNRNHTAKEMGKGSWFADCVATHEEWQAHLMDSASILAEGAQGYSLGLNQKFWPYCTSRDCTPARFLADMGIPVPMLRTVIGTARVHPIRVGNTPDGYSGDVYPDQKELSWEELQQIPELTTVTQRVRRVFSFSTEQIKAALFECAPDVVFLNFCNYDDNEARRVCREINQVSTDFMGKPVVKYAGFGPKQNDVITLNYGCWGEADGQ